MKPFRLLFVALGSWRRKGLPLVLDAFARLPAGAFELLILGPPAKGEDVLLAPARAALAAGQVRLLGFRADVDAVYGEADAVVIGSHYEAFSLVMLEALRHGRPIVTTDINGAREAVSDGENGFIVPRDPEALAAALRALRDDPERTARMGEASRARATRFAPDVVAAATEQVYLESAR